MGGWEQKKAGNEIKAAEKYLSILKSYRMPCTLFINGICLEEEAEGVRKFKDYDVELGGHTYNNFGGMHIFKSYIYRKIYGCVYGPSFYQEKDIKKTKNAFEKFGLKMNSWRTHAFGSNDKTFRALARNDVRYVSDLLGNAKPFFKDGIIHLPINIPPDQNTIAYGIFSPENRDPFASCTKGRIKPEEWFEILKKRIEKNEKEKVPSILLIHPATMAALDNFNLFKQVARFLSKYRAIKVSEFKL
jgi:hypothetical protein